MQWPSYEGRSFGQTDTMSFRALRLAIDAAGLSNTESIGCYQVAILEHPYTITEGGVLAMQSRRWLLAVQPHRLENGETMGVLGQLPLYLESKAECPGTWGKWHWDGNVEKPTLSPSIGSLGMNETPPRGWHGYLQAGRWVGCT